MNSKENKIIISFFIVIILTGLVFFAFNTQDIKIEISPYPDGKNFAFTITDDPDGNKLEAIRPLYDFLDSLDIKTTIAVWVQDPVKTSSLSDEKKSIIKGIHAKKKNI